MLNEEKSIQAKVTNGGFLEVLHIAMPLILSNSCHAANMFVDRLMLAKFSQDAVSASFAGGLTNFTLACFFVGTIGYTGTFVAQYYGAGQMDRVGQSTWQGIWLAVLGWLILGTGYFWARPLFELFKHAPSVTAQEIIYFRILCIGMIIFLLNTAISTFWTGRGKTALVLAISALITLINIPLNYIMIFGKCGFAPMGVSGAAWGTVLSELLGVSIYFILFLNRKNRQQYNTNRWRIDRDLLKRVVQYGTPSGIQLALDLISFNTFSILLGCYGTSVLEAASITFGINNIAFCPVIGIAIAAEILVGQAVGAQKIDVAKRSVKNCMIIVFIYNIAMIILFTIMQDLILTPFIRPNDLEQVESIAHCRIMLYFIAAYLLFDGFGIVASNAIRGAGDTKFCMWTMTLSGLFLFTIPCLIFYNCDASWPWLWYTYDAYVFALFIIFTARYLAGKWTKMRVI